MKKTITLVSSMFAMAAAIIVSTSSCKKDEPVPAKVEPPVISTPAAGVVLFNHNGNSDKYYQFTGTTSGYVTSGVGFAIAYGNGSASGNEFLLGGPTDLSISSVHSLTGSGAVSVAFYNLTVTAAQFDALTSSQTITDAILTGNKTITTTNQGTRIQSATSWAVGTVFGFETATHYVLGKVTQSPTGSRLTSGSIRIQFKFSQIPTAVEVASSN